MTSTVQSPIRKLMSSNRRVVTYEVEISNRLLHKHRVVRGRDPQFVMNAVQAHCDKWEEEVRKKHAIDAKQRERQQRQRSAEEKKQLAGERTNEATEIIEGLKGLLGQTLKVNDAIDWEKLKDFSPFWPAPEKPEMPTPPTKPEIPHEPIETDSVYQPQLGLLDKVASSRREKKLLEAKERFRQDHAHWEEEKQEVLIANATRDESYASEIEKLTEEYTKAVSDWEKEKAEYLQQQREQNEGVNRQRASYLAGEPEAVTSYCDMVLSRSEYPEFFPHEYNLDYNSENHMLIIDYTLPAPDDLPTLVEVKYAASKDDFTEKHLTPSQLDKLYDEVLYQVVLRTIHELFEADTAKALDAVVFNGIVNSIDKGTGNETTACVLSVQAKREDFLKINLANIEPKVCFKQLKGVGSSKLHSVTAVAPILQIRREDGRFVTSYEVANQLTEGYNLATMDWEDFEHLVREIFEEEFTSTGGEVKVTRASRDGGVDAVAFDPDPIRGGKIVIQAKRYINTVGVAVVRELYGTVINEGATKGILVTTADYGPDAYEFAKGKPLTLLSGANLLHLLEKHGHKARIDLREARQLAMEQPAKQE
ncbi:Mrr restriction system protein [Thermoflexales bacterium]|nr:Mrr restriction system protein [Thermoflexales bacterium]